MNVDSQYNYKVKSLKKKWIRSTGKITINDTGSLFFSSRKEWLHKTKPTKKPMFIEETTALH
jgi:hypothetical protein